MRNIHTISLLIGFISLILSGCGQKPLEPGKPVYVTIETHRTSLRRHPTSSR